MEVYTKRNRNKDRGEKCGIILPAAILRRIDDGKTDEVKEYLETKIYQKDTDALTILGLLYFYGVGLEMDKPKGKKMINEAVQKGNTAASWIIKDIYKNTN